MSSKFWSVPNIVSSRGGKTFQIFTADKSRQISTEYPKRTIIPALHLSTHFVWNYFRCIHHVHQIQKQRKYCSGKAFWVYKLPADRLYLRPFLSLTKYYVICSFSLVSECCICYLRHVAQDISCSHVADIAGAVCFIA